jgi:hypothetical protein
MNKRFENKLKMIAAVMALMKLNENIWKNSPAMVAAINELTALVDQILATRKVTDSNLTGLTDEKKEQQKKLIDKAFELASVLVAFASRTNDAALLATVDFTLSAFNRQREGKQVNTSKDILSQLYKHAEALAEYDVTEADATALEGLIEQFEQGLPANRVSVSERKAANKKLTGLFDSTDSHLEVQLDRLMVRYKTTHPDFYNSYLNARITVDYGTRYEKEKEGEEAGEVV